MPSSIGQLEGELAQTKEDLLKAKDEAIRAQEIALQTLQQRAAQRRAEMLEEISAMPTEQIIDTLTSRGFTLSIGDKTYSKK